MTEQNQTAQKPRRFSPIFIATVTPATIETRNGKNGAYTLMQGASVQRNGKADITKTVMAFGKSHEEVKSALIEGSPVDLAVQYDGGSLRAIGFPHAKAA